MWFVWLIVILAAYLLGSIPTAYLLVKMKVGVDIREVGSGNVGTTNSMRAAGWFTGLCVFIIDVAKGFVPAFVAQLIGGPGLAGAAGAAAIIGHLYPLWLGFRGGKGVAVSLGLVLALTPLLGLVSFAFWFAMLVVVGYVSVASSSALVFAALLSLFTGQLWEYSLLFCVCAALVVVRHVGNFQNLAAGNEQRSKFAVKWGKFK